MLLVSLGVVRVVNVRSQTLSRISRGSVHHVHNQLHRMMSRLQGVTACLRGQLVSQRASSTLKG